MEKSQTEGYKQRIQEMKELIEGGCKELTEFDESMVRIYIQGIEVFDDHFTVTFKSGINIDVQR